MLTDCHNRSGLGSKERQRPFNRLIIDKDVRFSLLNDHPLFYFTMTTIYAIIMHFFSWLTLDGQLNDLPPINFPAKFEVII